MNPNPSFWRSKSVFVTGHSGFKGGWLCFMLSCLGAEVHGYSLAPDTSPNFFGLARLEDNMESSHIADVRDFGGLSAAIKSANPDVVLHLAAQPLVRRSYADPIRTYETNVLGTANLLQAARSCPRLKSVVVVTTDKCYENHDWPWGYRETDALGGHDPYSNSKACQELVVAGFRSSYFKTLGISVATARAGNVIGGGDWSEDRLVPDAIRARGKRVPLVIRSPKATRPWQHVLEPVSAYLLLAERLSQGEDCASPWNFGPLDHDVRSVEDVLGLLSRSLPGGLAWHHERPSSNLHEAGLLKLDCSKAHSMLGWRPRWNLEMAIDQTTDWYTRVAQGEDARTVTSQQINSYFGATHQ
jgi:CDP-glucose 4,6-dehydratase